MDYGNIANTAIPHVTMLGTHFRIDYTDYKLTLIVQISFIVLVLPLLAIWIYFSAKYKKKSSKNNEQKELQGESGEEAGIDAKSEWVGSDDGPNQNKTDLQNQYELQRRNKITDEAAKTLLKGIDQKICYFSPFFVAHLAAVNLFDSHYISISTFYATVVIFAIFNLRKPCKSLIFLNLYIVPCIVSFVEFFMGNHQLGEHIK